MHIYGYWGLSCQSQPETPMRPKHLPRYLNGENLGTEKTA